MAESTYYYYRPFASKEEIERAAKAAKAGKTVEAEVKEPNGRLIISLTSIWKRYQDVYETEQQFAAEVLGNAAAQRMGRFELRVATAEDRAAFASSEDVYKAYNDYNKADEERDRVRLNAQKAVVKFLSEKIDTKEKVAEFCEQHDTDNRRLASFARAVYKADGTLPSEAFIEALADYQKDKAKDDDKAAQTKESVKKLIKEGPPKKEAATPAEKAKAEQDAENDAKGKTDVTEEPKAA